MSRTIGLDIGDRRIGVALSDPEGILASPFAVVERKEDAADAVAIADIVRSQQAGQIVAGLPQTMRGDEGQQAGKVRVFIEVLRQKTAVPIVLRDERLTTVSAKRLMREAGAKEKKKKVEYDAIAAAIILQGYLDESIKYDNDNTGDTN